MEHKTYQYSSIQLDIGPKQQPFNTKFRRLQYDSKRNSQGFAQSNGQGQNKILGELNMQANQVNVQKVNHMHPKNETLQNSRANLVIRSSSQPRLKTYKEEILKIPKVKQILLKDKFIYSQDIEKRLQIMGDVKNEDYELKQVLDLKGLQKPIQGKKKKRHKTNYKIPLTRQNINSLNNLIQTHIGHNQKYKNQQFIYLSQADYKEPFDLKKLQFMNQINPLKRKYKQKFPELKEGVLSKNKLLLEHVILNRNLKRQMKLDDKKLRGESMKRLTKDKNMPFSNTFLKGNRLQ